MRLNPDCIRSVLLCVEENCNIREHCTFIDEKYLGITNRNITLNQYQIELKEKFDNDELIYHIRYCIEAGLISEIRTSKDYIHEISDLTPRGHELISKIRDNKNWSAVKSALSSIRDYSLSAISAIADGVTSAMISSYFSGKTNP